MRSGRESSVILVTALSRQLIRSAHGGVVCPVFVNITGACHVIGGHSRGAAHYPVRIAAPPFAFAANISVRFPATQRVHNVSLTWNTRLSKLRVTVVDAPVITSVLVEPQSGVVAVGQVVRWACLVCV